MSKKDLVLKALRNEKTERVPVGFWFHYLQDPGGSNGVAEPRFVEENLAGHRKFYTEFKPDMVKIMSDGLFHYPNELFRTAKSAKELRGVQSIGENHPWIEKSVDLVKRVTALFGGEVPGFYNIFSPATTFKSVRRSWGQNPNTILADFFAEDRDAVLHALEVAGKDLGVLAARVIKEGGADGIYLSTQDLNDPRFGAAEHRDLLRPGDAAVLEGANRAGRLNILHICGYHGHRNDLSHFADYPAQIINWAAVVEGVPLGQGKKLFGGKPVIGGFDNTEKGVLYRGTQAEVEAETERLLAEAGKTGVILGADCTIPPDIDYKRLGWVRDKAAKL